MKFEKSIVIQSVFFVLFFVFYLAAGIILSESFLDDLPVFITIFLGLFLSQKGIFYLNHRFILNAIVEHNLEKFFVVIAVFNMIAAILCLFDSDNPGCMLLFVILTIKANGCVNAFIMSKTEYVDSK